MHVNFLPKTLVNSYSPIYFPVYKCNLIHKPECSILCGCLKILGCAFLYPNILKKRHILNKALKAITKILFQNQTTTKYLLSLISLSYQWSHTGLSKSYQLDVVVHDYYLSILEAEARGLL